MYTKSQMGTWPVLTYTLPLQTVWPGGGDILLGDRGASQPMLTETMGYWAIYTRLYVAIWLHMGFTAKKREYTGWVIPHRLLWQLEHLRCKQIALHGGGDALFGNRGTGQPVFAETLGVDDDLSHNVKILTFDNICLYTFGLTMYCPGFTVTSLHTSLVLHAGSWDGLYV